MQPAEALRAMAFVGAVVAVYLLAAGFAVGWVLERRGRRPPPGRRRVLLRRATFGLAAAGLLCIGYGFGVEPYWPEVTHTRLATPRLAGAARPIRVVHLSDLHSDAAPRLEERLPDLVAAERPDLIVFTGDAINSPDGLPVFRRCLTRLAAIAPTFVVRGNWDTWFWSDLDLFGGTGARELDGEPVRVDVAGAAVWVAGAGVGREARLGRALAAVPSGACTIVLHHYPYPDHIPEDAAGKVDLFCAGHVHGGQVALPFYGALVTLSRYGKRYEAGLYRPGPFWMYVSRGVGMEGGERVPRVRFCARPEIAVLELEGTLSNIQDSSSNAQ